MRTLFTTIPSTGHFHPLVPLARAVEDAGHEVAFACAESLGPSVRGAGFRTFAAGLNRDGDGDPEFNELKARARRLAPGFEITQLGIADVIYGVRARRMLSGLASVCRVWKPDVIVRDSYEAAGAVVGDLLGIPHASVEIMPLFDLAPMQNAIHLQLDRARAEVGLPPDPTMLHRYLTLCFAPERLLGDAARPATLHLFRPSVFDASGDEGLPEWVRGLPDRPTIYVTFGTVANVWRSDSIDLLRRILAGLGDEPMNVLVTVGRDSDPPMLGTQPDHIRVERYVPQSLLLEHCDLCLTHGGFNTLIGVIEAGLPQVLVPLLADNPHNARRCAALELAIVLQPEDVTPEAVRAAVRAILHEPRYRANVQRVRDEMHRLPGVDAAVGLLETLASALVQ